MITRRTIFDIIKEADDDQNQADTSADDAGTADAASDSADTSQDTTEKDDGATDGDDADGGDFDINVDLDDSDGGDDSGSSDDGGAASSSPDPTTDDDTEEAVPANTDIFNSLSPEEQQIKIMELKNLYSTMYNSLSDIIDSFSDIEITEKNKPVIDRVSAVLYDLRTYMADYICNLFPLKSYIENDINFNRFLYIIHSIQSILDELVKGNENS